MRPALLAALAVAVLIAVAGHSAHANALAVVVPHDGLNLRAAPGTDKPALVLIPGGTRLAITGQANADNWYPAVYRGKRGWVLGSFLAFDELTAAAARKATVLPPDGLNLRTAPHDGADVAGVLAAGSALTATGQATSDGWVLVQAGEQQGWVSADYLSFESSGERLGTASRTEVNGAGSTRILVRYYHPSFEGGRMACGGVYRAADATIAATNTWPCGTNLRVCTSTGACIVVTVRDTGGMGPNEIDLSASAFQKLATLPTGVISASAEVVTP